METYVTGLTCIYSEDLLLGWSREWFDFINVRQSEKMVGHGVNKGCLAGNWKGFEKPVV